VFERRSCQRLDFSVPVSLQRSEQGVSYKPLTVVTDNISLKGVSIVIRLLFKNGRLSVEGVDNPKNLIPFLLLEGQMLDLGIRVLPEERTIEGTGRVTWFRRGVEGAGYCLRAGISLRKLKGEDKQKWIDFVTAVRRLQEAGCVALT
jgi:hypothetical protein